MHHIDRLTANLLVHDIFSAFRPGRRGARLASRARRGRLGENRPARRRPAPPGSRSIFRRNGVYEGLPTENVRKTEALNRNINDPIFQELAGNEFNITVSEFSPTVPETADTSR